MKNETLNCPVCGNQPRISRVHNEVVVNCECSFEHQLEYMVDEDDPIVEELFKARYDRQSAITQWNLSVIYYEHQEDLLVA